MDFPGKHHLVSALDQAVARPGAPLAVAGTLQRLHAAGITLPARLLEPVAGHHARRELHVSDVLGYSVVASEAA